MDIDPHSSFNDRVPGEDVDDVAGCSSEFAACISRLSDREKNQISNILA